MHIQAVRSVIHTKYMRIIFFSFRKHWMEAYIVQLFGLLYKWYAFLLRAIFVDLE